MVDLPAAAPPVVTAVSNYTWCATRRTQLVASRMIGDAAELQLNTKLQRVNSSGESLLMLLNAQRITNPGGQLSFVDADSKCLKADASCRCCSCNAFVAAASAASMKPACEHNHFQCRWYLLSDSSGTALLVLLPLPLLQSPCKGHTSTLQTPQ
jgi:hypothetical protein